MVRTLVLLLLACGVAVPVAGVRTRDPDPNTLECDYINPMVLADFKINRFCPGLDYKTIFNDFESVLKGKDAAMQTKHSWKGAEGGDMCIRQVMAFSCAKIYPRCTKKGQQLPVCRAACLKAEAACPEFKEQGVRCEDLPTTDCTMLKVSGGQGFYFITVDDIMPILLVAVPTLLFACVGIDFVRLMKSFKQEEPDDADGDKDSQSDRVGKFDLPKLKLGKMNPVRKRVDAKTD